MLLREIETKHSLALRMNESYRLWLSPDLDTMPNFDCFAKEGSLVNDLTLDSELTERLI